MRQNRWSRIPRFTAASLLLVIGFVTSCSQTENSESSVPPSESPSPQSEQTETEATPVVANDPLADTTWRLVEFQSADDEIGTLEPEDPSAFIMRLQSDGTVTMKLDCNNATGTWSSEPSDDGQSGSFSFGPLAVTRALCAPPNIDERIASDADFVRSYVLQDGRLHFSLMADGGIYTWEPNPGEK
ncbi:MAG: META domain-containing protein [Synechococcus sp.]